MSAGDRCRARGAGVAALALLAGVASAFPALFELDRSALARGEVWRLWTGHLVHGSVWHYAYDVGALALLGLALGGLRRLAWLAPLVGVALLVACPGVEWYYGLSAVLHAWVVLEALSAAARPGPARWLALAFSAGVVAKATVEATLGASLFTGGADFGGPVLHASHLVGAAVGACVGAGRLRGPAAHPAGMVAPG